jgi:hypothetical protein
VPQIYDTGPTALLPFRRKVCLGIFMPEKHPTASAGFEPAILGMRADNKPLHHVFKLKRCLQREHNTTAINGGHRPLTGELTKLIIRCDPGILQSIYRAALARTLNSPSTLGVHYVYCASRDAAMFQFLEQFLISRTL